MCQRTPVDEYVYKISSKHLEKRLRFALLNAQKGPFYAIYGEFGDFLIFTFRPILAIQKVF